MNIEIKRKQSVGINKGRIGLFFEDINYGLDGGLYAEMIENRSFEFVEAYGIMDQYRTKYDGLYGWSVHPSVSGGATLSIQEEQPLNQINPHYLVFSTSQEQMAFTNKAYDGLYLKNGLSYEVSLYARSQDYKGQIDILIEKDGKIITDSMIAPSVMKEWVKYRTNIVCGEDCCAASFIIKLNSPGTVCFDFISMLPSDAVLGLFRKDLVQLLKEMNPGFLRFPGGCIIEGNTLDNRYQWKKSIGKVEERKTNWNRWAVHDNTQENQVSKYSHYNQSLGIGYYEYFLLCEYLGAKPLPVISVGLACQFQSSEMVQVDDPDFGEYIKDALDLIEFANGPIDSQWGKIRMQMGHPEPFGLDMLGIGNEQWESEQVDFFHRYELFEKKIHNIYPNMKLIGSAGPDVKTEKYAAAWNYYRNSNKNDYVYAVDEHYYMDPEWFCNHTHFYDSYPRDIKVFAGEYAAHIGWGMNRPEQNNWKAALSEAAFLTGVERNADLVVLACYAPLFARLGYTQWSTDLIWFDGEKCYGSPSYYIQKLYSLHQGTELIRTEHDLEEIPYSVTYDEKEKSVIIKLANITDHPVHIVIDAEYELQERGNVYYIHGMEEDINTIDQPCKLSIKRKEIDISKRLDYVIEKKAFHVIIMYCRDHGAVV